MSSEKNQGTIQRDPEDLYQCHVEIVRIDPREYDTT